MKYLVLFLIVWLFFACGNQTTDKNANAAKREYAPQLNPVEVMVLQKGPFLKEMVNNGKLVALRKSELQFRVGEQLEQLNYRNGDAVKAGKVIAGLNTFTYKQQLNSSQIHLKKAGIELQNILLGQGYKSQDSSAIPSHIYEIATVKSGYADALQSLNTAQFNLESARLVAPFSGILANIAHKQYDRVNSGAAFCTLIDDSEFEVEFRIVESEVDDIRLKDEVKIMPFSGQQVFKGRISEINPVVDDNGLILVKALVKNPGGLMDGMNVKVLVEKEIPDQLVVPKSAIVLRDNYEVLFKCMNDTVAFWVYVRTIHENSNSYAIEGDPVKGGTIEAGDTIITTGNLNIAHESKVVVK
jgi:RND family efflux transporter MFP subunit